MWSNRVGCRCRVHSWINQSSFRWNNKHSAQTPDQRIEKERWIEVCKYGNIERSRVKVRFAWLPNATWSETFHNCTDGNHTWSGIVIRHRLDWWRRRDDGVLWFESRGQICTSRKRVHRECESVWFRICPCESNRRCWSRQERTDQNWAVVKGWRRYIQTCRDAQSTHWS